MYAGNSIVDYLKSIGQASDYASRATLAGSKGITGYSGSAEQNTQLLNILRGGGGTTPAGNSNPSPQTTSTPQSSPQTTPVPQTAQTTGATTPEGIPISQLPPELVYNGQLDISNPDKQTQYNALVTQWKQNNSGTTTGAGTPGGTSFLNAPQINLPELYQGMFDSSGISDLEKSLSSQTQAFNDAQSKINDNPFLSEASRVGRIQKLQNDFNANTKGTRDDIAMKKADIETKLNLQMKQFDINSQQAQLALSQFQTLLGAGALDNASGEDIANITRATGISSSMIQAMIANSKKKDIQTSVISFDDGTNQGFALINTQTGEIIKKENIAQSEPAKPTASSTKDADATTNQQNLIINIKDKYSLRELIDAWAVPGGLSIEDIYRLYNTYSPWGKATETLAEVKQGKYND